MVKYITLLKVLDGICEEAPEAYKTYHPTREDIRGVETARAKAFIHLFLKVRCGVGSFTDRHNLVTDDTGDGGLDAYHINSEQKILFLIQSKFRQTEENFKVKSINADDLVKMEIDRILKGEPEDSRGIKFNDKIKRFQNEWAKIEDHAHYKYVVVFLGNLTNYSNEQIKRLIGTPSYEVYDFNKTYKELVFPLCSGTYYIPEEMLIKINLFDKEQPVLKQKVKTKYGEYNVRIVFVPAKEIGRVMHKYKNSILKYNPRNYLSLSNNKVNKGIKDSITENTDNDFALLNNGITILSETFDISEATGKISVGQIIMKNPQIINGGQTAYTLGKIYDDYREKLEIFGDKEVMLRIIILGDGAQLNKEFVEEISNSTNQQSRVEEADRRSNEKIQLEIQERIFDEFGYFYERKRGEFFYGTSSNLLDERLIIDRYDFLKVYLAFKGNPSDARRSGNDTLFKPQRFSKILSSADDYKLMLLAHIIFQELNQETSKKKWGSGLRYGKMAIIAAAGVVHKDQELTNKNIKTVALDKTRFLKEKWGSFEERVSRKRENRRYKDEKKRFDFDNYYKGATINKDIEEFFKSYRNKI